MTQEDGGWVDLQRFADAAFWVEVAEVTQPTGGTVQLTIESSPSLDENMFRPAAQPVAIAPVTDPISFGTIPLLVRTARTPTTVPLSRWTRWRLSVTPGSTGPWDATFRIRGAGGRSSFVLPNQLSGCLLWLRGDLGIHISTFGGVDRWADQSGKGNDATAFNEPFYNLPGRSINGQKVVSFDANNSKYMTLTSSLGSPTALHAMVVHRRLQSNAVLPVLTGFWAIGGSTLLTHMPWSGDNFIYDDGGGAVRYNCGLPKVPLNQSQVYEVQNAPGSWANFLNGKLQFSSPTNTVGTGEPTPLIGSGQTSTVFYDGDMAEVIIYNRILSPNERSLLINYLNGRYGLGAV